MLTAKRSRSKTFKYLSMLKKLLFLLTSLIITHSSLAQTWTPFGNGLEWSITDQVLSIRGNGAMPDFEWDEIKPWGNYPDEIVIGSGITHIGDYSFNYSSIKNITFEANSQLQSIGKGAFGGSSSYPSIGAIPASVTDIGTQAFRGCTITFEENSQLQTLKENSFESCRITIPVGTSIFETGSTPLSNTNYYSVEDGNNYFSATDGVLFNKDKTTLLYFPGSKNGSYSIPATVTTIADRAFQYSHLSSIQIPSSVTTIGNGFFGQSLTEIIVESGNTHYIVEDGVLLNKDKTILLCAEHNKTGSYTIPETVKIIQDNAFRFVPIEQVTIPNGVISIGERAFEGSDIQTVEIPGSVLNIGEGAFNGSYLQEINVVASNPNYSSENGVLFNKDKTNLIQYPRFKEGEYTIPNTVTVIKKNAFDGCTGLTKVTIPNSVITIEEYAFSIYSEELKSVVFEPNSRLETIGNYAFESCKFSSITIPASVKTIGEGALSYCDFLQSIIFEKGIQLERIERSTFSSNPSLTSITIPASVKSIGKRPFNSCDQLQSIIFEKESQLEKIENETFSYLENLITITIPASVKIIGNKAFSNCWELQSVIFENNSVLETIEKYAFGECYGLSTITIPASVKTIGEKAFQDCRSLQSVIFENNSLLETIQWFAFENCSSLTSIIIPSSIKTIEGCAFGGCENLQSVVVENNSQLTSIGNAFALCGNLSFINIPASVISIDSDTFSNNCPLQNVSVDWDTPLDLHDYTFGSYATSCILEVPVGTEQAYKNHEAWGKFIVIEKTLSILPSAGANGTITPSEEELVAPGANRFFGFVPNYGYEIDQVLIDGTNNPTAVSAGSYTFSDVTANHSIEVSFKLKQYTISVSAGSNGSISPNTNQTVNHGSSQEFTITPETNYEIDQVVIDGTNNPTAVAAGTYTFSDVTANHSISVSFKLKQYTISVSAGSNGSILPNTNQSINHGGSQAFSITPATNYEIDQVLIDGTNNPTAVSAGSYTFSDVTANHSIEVSFKLKQYTIAVSTGSNGSISPNNNQSVNHGGSQEFTITPATNYEIDQVLIDGTNNPTAVAAGSYTFSDVTANHSISVSFKLKQYTISVSAGSNGSISPNTNQSVNHGGSQAFSITPATNYEIDQVLIDGTNNPTAVAAGTYTFSNVTANHSIEVSFKLKQYTIAVSTGSNGSISPNTNQSVNHGGSQSFTITPATNYEIDKVLIDGTNNPTAVAAGTYTFTNITGNHSIEVSFKATGPNTHTISVTAGSNGNISPSTNQTVADGGNSFFNIIPNTGYEINQVLIDGTNNPTAVMTGSYNFSNVTGNQSIEASFKRKQYTVSVSSGINGSISPNSTQTVLYDDNQVFTITPNIGYEIYQVLIDGINNPAAASSGNYTFSNVTQNHNIAVSFRQLQYAITASAGEHGSITPSGIQSVEYGGSKSFAIVADPKYKIDQVLIDGVNNPEAVATGNYLFFHVSANHSIAATFVEKAELNEIIINEGRLLVEFSPALTEYEVLLPCGISATSMVFRSDVAISIDGEMFGTTAVKDIVMEKAGRKTIRVTVVNGAASNTYTIHVIRPFENVIIQLWDDVLSVVKNKADISFTDSYQWYKNDIPMPGETRGNLYLPNKDDGKYSVMLVSSNGVKAPSCQASLQMPAEIMSLRAYPNPTADIITIEDGDWQQGNGELRLHDLNGKLIKTQKVSSPVTKIDMEGLKRGAYVVKMGDKSIKVIKE